MNVCAFSNVKHKEKLRRKDMFQTIFTNIILAGVVLGFGVSLLNKMGVVPIVRFKGIVKALIVLTIVITIVRAIS